MTTNNQQTRTRQQGGPVVSRFAYAPVTMTFIGDLLKSLEGLDVAQRKMFLNQMRQTGAANRQRRRNGGRRTNRNSPSVERVPQNKEEQEQEVEREEKGVEQPKLNFKKAVESTQAETKPENPVVVEAQ